jgi:hypothetical protein
MNRRGREYSNYERLRLAQGAVATIGAPDAYVAIISPSSGFGILQGDSIIFEALP